jgi:hypothetical protein
VIFKIGKIEPEFVQFVFDIFLVRGFGRGDAGGLLGLADGLGFGEFAAGGLDQGFAFQLADAFVELLDEFLGQGASFDQIVFDLFVELELGFEGFELLLKFLVFLQ